MIDEQRYHKTVGILYDAYFKDTLKHGRCNACAVGNIVAANCGYPIDCNNCVWKKDGEIIRAQWSDVFITRRGNIQYIGKKYYTGEAKEQIDSTGYTWQELAKIEYAFETAYRGKSEEDYMFNGLVAVLDVLKEIHEVEDDDLIEANKNKFHSHYLTKSI